MEEGGVGLYYLLLKFAMDCQKIEPEDEQIEEFHNHKGEIRLENEEDKTFFKV
ncbi:MAG: hypothetical protein GY772_21545 [bacterium]|nr:hypothetical protein [bacterium]